MISYHTIILDYNRPNQSRSKDKILSCIYKDEKSTLLNIVCICDGIRLKCLMMVYCQHKL